MKGIKKRIPMSNLLSFCLCAVLIFGFLSFISCTSKEKAEEPGQQAPDLQAKVNELQKEVTAKDAEINQLKNEKADFLSRTPEPYEVQKGDSHWKIVYNYLTEELGIPDGEAKKIMADIPLSHPILVGFRVRNYSEGEDYGSSLAQGSGAVSPGTLQRIEKTKIEAEKVRLRNKIAEARIEGQKQNAELKDKVRELEKENNELKSQTASLEEKTTDFQSQNEDLESRLNSVYYLADTKDSLKAKGKTSLGAVSFADFQNRIDLRETDIIELKAGDFGVSAIKKVTLVPKTLDAKRDYRIEISGGGQSAKIHLLNKDKFRLARIIVILN